MTRIAVVRDKEEAKMLHDTGFKAICIQFCFHVKCAKFELFFSIEKNKQIYCPTKNVQHCENSHLTQTINWNNKNDFWSQFLFYFERHFPTSMTRVYVQFLFYHTVLSSIVFHIFFLPEKNTTTNTYRGTEVLSNLCFSHVSNWKWFFSSFYCHNLLYHRNQINE